MKIELIFDLLEKSQKQISKNQKNIYSLICTPHINCKCSYCKFPEKQIVPFRWNNRTLLWKDEVKIQKKTTQTFNKLIIILNNYHHTNISNRGWRLILWPWLYSLHVVIFDMEEKLKLLTPLLNKKELIINSNEFSELIPENHNDFSNLVKNFKVYKLILVILAPKFLKNIVIKSKFNINNTKKKYQKKTIATLFFKWFLNIYYFLIKNNKIVFFESYIPWSKRIIYYLKSRSFPLVNINIPDHILQSQKVDLNFRDNKDYKKDFLLHISVKLIPKSYLENFNLYNDVSKKCFPKNPLNIFTGTGHMHSAIFTIWAAKKLKKSKLILLQHGGHYGIGKTTNLHDHEFTICDYFLSWGWVLEKYPKVLPFGIFFKPIKHNTKKEPILYIISSGSNKYVSNTMSMPLGEQWKEYIKSMGIFYNNLYQDIKSNTILRPYPSNLVWVQNKIYKSNFKNIKIENTSSNINLIIAKANIVICTWNSTNFIHLLYSNKPTVSFWDPIFFEIEDSAILLIENLYKSKILHKNPKSASEFVNRNWDDVDKWWYSKPTQEARINFINNYAKDNNLLKKIDINSLNFESN